ncbi:E3 ubiquitin-protein ligase RNF139-like [Acanthaster planci]|uniref:E3 ubiquitin-protein ligase RNF139-like n=1 Tax=Acanthaster planci TaxID=133434 RepID=A0A8B7YH00_ACAPL|nr:E3 ubiquitin-protein ligase RNF139-like [Acanthaster planci]XP_022091863.1 E3 ubiquitin-protein ligase RNF139-like [Acanthaster planci]XP_022091864.1 E3 ubiquitin-protein ligase RNF139-like [Acanthaster planci]
MMHQLFYYLLQYPYDKMMFKLGRKIQAVLGVALRVPSLFLIDAILNLRIDTGQFGVDHPVWCSIVLVICLFVAMMMFCLTTRTLFKIYILLLCIGTLASVVWWNSVMLQKVDQDKKVSDWDVLMSVPNAGEPSRVTPVQILLSMEFVLYVLVQIFYAFVYVACITLLPERFTLTVWLAMCAYFISPMMIRLCLMYYTPDNPLYTTVNTLKALSVLVPSLEVAAICVSNIVWGVMRVPLWYTTYRFMLQNLGLNSLLENAWVEFQVPNVLRSFWLLRFAIHIAQIFFAFVSNAVLPGVMARSLGSLNGTHVVGSHPDENFAWMAVLELATHGCDSNLAVLGLTAVVSYLSYYLGKWADRLMGGDSDEVAHIGTVTAILFFILSLQTGLPGLEPMKRFVRLFRNFILLITALLHFIHNMLNHVMMALSTSHTASLWKHGRALGMSVALILIPTVVLSYLWMTIAVGTWLLAVTAFCLELIIKVTVTLIIYTLFLLDTYSDQFWENLDDYVYYIKATGSTIEFLFGVFLFGNGVWILFFESGGIIRAIMICIHAYFNIFQLGKNGWKKFQNRRMAVHKINSLPVATDDQLRQHSDVCAICYQELTTARITPCQHLFHALCLRKWLYVQDTCPLCHKEIMQNVKSDKETGQNDEHELVNQH